MESTGSQKGFEHIGQVIFTRRIESDGWTFGAYYVDADNKDFYKQTASFVNTDKKDLARSTAYITVGRTF